MLEHSYKKIKYLIIKRDSLIGVFCCCFVLYVKCNYCLRKKYDIFYRSIRLVENLFISLLTCVAAVFFPLDREIDLVSEGGARLSGGAGGRGGKKPFPSRAFGKGK